MVSLMSSDPLDMASLDEQSNVKDDMSDHRNRTRTYYDRRIATTGAVYDAVDRTRKVWL
jgi:hypothetical protein